MPGTIKILHVNGCMRTGGAEKRMLDIMRNIDRKRYQLDFCSISGKVGELDTEIRALGGQVHYCPLNSHFAGNFRRLLRAHDYRGVHSHIHYPSGIIMYLAAMEKVPLRIVHFRTAGDISASTLRQRTQQRLFKYLINRYATDIIGVSKAALTHSWRLDWVRDARCQVIYNGLDTAMFNVLRSRTSIRDVLSIPSDSLLCIHVGRMEPCKNQQKVLSVYKNLLSIKPDSFLLFVGAGDNPSEKQTFESIKCLLENFGLSDKVMMLGRRDDVCDILHAADILLFPSKVEGLPGVVLESVAASTPVLSSNLPGIVEIADRLPLVHCLPLAELDQNWACRAIEIVQTYASAKKDSSGLKAIRNSDFAISNCTRKICAVWDRAYE